MRFYHIRKSLTVIIQVRNVIYSLEFSFLQNSPVFCLQLLIFSALSSLLIMHFLQLLPQSINRTFISFDLTLFFINRLTKLSKSLLNLKPIQIFQQQHIIKMFSHLRWFSVFLLQLQLEVNNLLRVLTHDSLKPLQLLILLVLPPITLQL